MLTCRRLDSTLTHSASRSVLVSLSTLLLLLANRLRRLSTREMRLLAAACVGGVVLLGDQCLLLPGVTASSSVESLLFSCSHLRPTFLPHVASPAHGHV